MSHKVIERGLTSGQTAFLRIGLVSFLFKAFTDINPFESKCSLQTSVNVASDCTIAKSGEFLIISSPWEMQINQNQTCLFEDVPVPR